MSLSRVPAHTAAGGFSTLVAMVPWKIAEAAGQSETTSVQLAGLSLALLAITAWSLRKAPWVRARNYPIAAFGGEVFSLAQYLHHFAAFSLIMLLLYGGIWIALSLYGI